MEYRINATELARSLGDVLGRIRFRGDTFIVERNGKVVARIGPPEGGATPTLGGALRAWSSGADPDPNFPGLPYPDPNFTVPPIPDPAGVQFLNLHCQNISRPEIYELV